MKKTASAQRKRIILLILLFVLMVAAIFITIALTDGRELRDFTGRDRQIFYIFLAVEAAIVVSVFVLAVKIDKQLRAEGKIPSPEELTKADKALRGRNFLCWLAAFLIVMAVFMFTAEVLPQNFLPSAWTVWILVLLCLAPLVFLVVNIVIYDATLRKWQNTSVSDMQQEFLQKKELAKTSADQLYGQLKKQRVRADIFAVIWGLDAVLIAVVTEQMLVSAASGISVILILFAFALLGCCLLRIRFKERSSEKPEELENYIDPASFPVLHRLAEEAAARISLHRKVYLIAVDSGEISIVDTKDYCVLLLGVYLMDQLNTDEFSTILFHEYTHIANNRYKKEAFYHTWLDAGPGGNQIATPFSFWLFGGMDLRCYYDYILFERAVSVLVEAEADQAMVRNGQPETAASAIIKCFYESCFDWELGSYDTAPSFVEETLERIDYISQNIIERRERIARRAETWKKLIPKEIISRSATHPTTKMRLDSFGVSDPIVFPRQTDGEYRAECDRLIEKLDAITNKEYRGSWEDYHKENYSDPMKKITEWKDAGEPLIPEQYGDIVADLCKLGRIEEADQLCVQAIQTLPDPAAAYGAYVHGSLLIRRLDPEGLPFLYRSLINSNFWEEGLNDIGAFCCMTGNQEELDRYREKAVALMQEMKDYKTAESILLPRDKLSAEQLPEGKRETILQYILSLGKDQIEQVYLVRKEITAEKSTSAFVIRFKTSCAPEQRWEIMHQVFSYLDTESNWQYSLFDYDDVRQVPFHKIEGSLIYPGPEG